MSTSTLLGAKHDVEKSSTLFDSIGSKELKAIGRWASRMDPSRDGLVLHELMLASDGPFFRVMREVSYSLLVMADPKYSTPVDDSLTLTPAWLRRLGARKCLGPWSNVVRCIQPCRDVVRTLSRFCKDLKSLTVKSPIDEGVIFDIVRLVAEHPHSLEELEIENRWFDSPRFQLPDYLFPRLKSLMLSGELDFNVVVRLLQNVGQTLEKVELIELRLDGSFQVESDSKVLFEAMQVNCTKLTSINLDCFRLPLKEYENLLISYGHQLRFVCFGVDYIHMDYEFESLCRIVPHCPNLELNVDITHSPSEFDDLLPFLKQLASYITGTTPMDDCEDVEKWEAFESFANRLVNLKHLDFYNSDHSRQAMHAMFAAPKPALEKFDLYNAGMCRDDNFMRKIASAMPNLRDFTIHAMYSSEDVDTWCTFLSGALNLRHLMVDFIFRDDTGQDRNTIVQCCHRLLHAVRESKELEYVSISDETNNPFEKWGNINIDIQATQLFRFRSVRIILFGIEMFLPSARPPTSNPVTDDVSLS